MEIMMTMMTRVTTMIARGDSDDDGDEM